VLPRLYLFEGQAS